MDRTVFSESYNLEIKILAVQKDRFWPRFSCGRRNRSPYDRLVTQSGYAKIVE